jgi:uncharacterized protein
MPRFAVHCLDAPDALPRRLANYDAHRAYLAQPSAVKTVISGPLLADDGTTMIGSLFVLDAPSRADIETFHQSDPFYKAAVWRTVSIHQYAIRVDNR